MLVSGSAFGLYRLTVGLLCRGLEPDLELMLGLRPWMISLYFRSQVQVQFQSETQVRVLDGELSDRERPVG